MRTLKLCVCLIVSGALFILGGCKKAVTNLPHEVGITECTASPDTVTVHEGDQVHWQPGDQHDYTISFSDQSEPTANPFKVKHGVSNPAHLIHGHSGCVKDAKGEFDCKYSLTRDNETTPCKDPGIHIIPGGGGGG
jgi:plastocyanin